MVNLHFQRIHALFGGHHLITASVLKLVKACTAVRSCASTQPAQFHDAGRDAVEFGIKLAGKVFFCHSVLLSRNGP